MTAEEAFANMFKNIGKAFIDMATQMIAKALILKALGIAFGGGGGSTGLTVALAAGRCLRLCAENRNFGFASGGYVSQPTMGMIGEGGENEYVIPADKMSSALQRYNSGARGDAVIEGANSIGGSTALMDADAPRPSTSNWPGDGNLRARITFARTSLPSVVSQAGKQGEARALRRLQMSPTTPSQSWGALMEFAVGHFLDLNVGSGSELLRWQNFFIKENVERRTATRSSRLDSVA